MISSYVNLSRALAALLLAVACTSGGGTSKTSESTAVAPGSSVPVQAAAPAQDSALIRADLSRIQGSPNAPLWVIEVSDFQCPFCRQWHERTYAAFRDEFVKTGKVRMAYVNFPIASHEFAVQSAEAAMCAGEQGKFWEMHDALFATQDKWEQMPSPTPVFDSLAKASGVDLSRWRQCVTSGKMKPLISADRERAAHAGANATPSFMIGNKIYVGAQPIGALRDAVDSAMTKIKPLKAF
jgi:protein-disulfide isomerase